MKLDIKATATASALLWGGAVLTVGVVNLLKPSYGGRFLRGVASIYPGYRARPELRNVAVGTVYAAADGAMGGALFAWLYNRFIPRQEEAGELPLQRELEGGSVRAKPAV